MDKLTHAWWGTLLISWIAVVVPLWIALWQGHAKLRQWVVSPLVAVGLEVVAGIAAWFIGLPFAREGIGQAIVGIGCCIGIGYGTGRFVTRPPPGDTHIRGALVEGSWEEPGVTDGLRKPREGMLTLAGVPIGAEDEAKHFKIIGEMEAGRPAVIRDLLTGVLSRGDRAVIADADGGYQARFYDASRGDVILNPLDTDAVQWDIFGEITPSYDVEHLAEALIPLGEGLSQGERFYARAFFTAAMRHCLLNGKPDSGELWRLLSGASHEELKPVVADTPVSPLLKQGDATVFGAVRSIVTSAVGVLEPVKNRHEQHLSVRQWFGSGRGSLFIPYRTRQVDRSRVIIPSWIKMAMFETLSVPEGMDARLWFFIDPLDELSAIDGLQRMLAPLQRSGGRCVVGFGSTAELSRIYGWAGAQAIIESCRNTVILRCPAGEDGGTSRLASDLIGAREVLRSVRGRETVTSRFVTEYAVLASEIEQLPDLTGFLTVVSGREWRRVRFRS